VIALYGLCKTHDGGRSFAVRDVSLTVPAGSLLVLLGGSGSGKTTTLKMINRLVEPTGGRVEIDGRDVRTVNPVELRRGIGYVFQGIGLFPHMTVADNVAVVPRLLGWKADRVAERVDELLTLVRLPPGEYRDRLPHQLSGGQQQRIGFARALAGGAKVLLLDEPFGALDPITRDELRDEFQAIRRRLGLTAVMVTHDMTEALLTADRIAVLNAGRLVRLGTPHELLTNPGDPLVAALMAAPKRQADRLEALTAGAAGTCPRIWAVTSCCPSPRWRRRSPSACRWASRPAAGPGWPRRRWPSPGQFRRCRASLCWRS
jgi:osmoprotectant transport system ATP-binding protein